jgi:hypothetical protein
MFQNLYLLKSKIRYINLDDMGYLNMETNLIVFKNATYMNLKKDDFNELVKYLEHKRMQAKTEEKAKEEFRQLQINQMIAHNKRLIKVDERFDEFFSTFKVWLESMNQPDFILDDQVFSEEDRKEQQEYYDSLTDEQKRTMTPDLKDNKLNEFGVPDFSRIDPPIHDPKIVNIEFSYNVPGKNNDS